jgi:4-hydroxybutyrate dehydrogenase
MALITYLTRIQFDFGAVKLLPQELGLLKIARPLVVTDKGVVAAGLLDRVRGALPQGVAATVYDGTPANPTEAAVRVALETYRAAGCDGIVALGGGSAMDLAKAAAILATHPGPSLAPYAMVEGGAQRITPAVAPVVAIPTTAGTGSEVGRGAIIVLDDGRKLGIGSANLIPKLALCDPYLTLDLPATITAGTGMDAIAHCLETYMAPAVNPPAEAIALDGLDKAWRHLERAVSDGHDREARWNMMMAAMEGAMSFQKGLGAVHALSHPLGALKAPVLHHGTLNAVFLPGVIRFNAPVLGAKLDRMAAIMGTEASGGAVADAVARLTQRVGLPTSLVAMGAPREVLPAIADAALKDHCHATNPRRATREDYLALLDEAWAA